ncbi:MAG: VWA domain-containing protein [Clostridia bacterium]|nr:VWA domain-containing protein [Clostridia bacterium]
MKKLKKGGMISIIILIVLVIIAGGTLLFFVQKEVKISGVDDWKYNPKKSYSNKSSSVGGFGSLDSATSSSSIISSIGTQSSSSLDAMSTSESYLGYTVGGASNVDSFRENIKNNYLPLTTDITYNGLYSEYYFDTGVINKKSNEMFYPSYSCAVSTDPISKEQEYYLAVGLNSNIKESDFNRKKLNVVIVLDISGSMSSSFSSYYYDKKGYDSENKSKMKIAEECINNLIDKLNEEDRLGVVLFDNDAYLGKELNLISDTNIEAIKDHILEIEPQGGTNFSAGYKKGTELFDEYLDDKDYQNRIIVITDAMPNAGDTSSSGLMGSIKQNATNKIYTSLIGVGVDFNTELTEKISDVKGANYYSVHSSEEFNKTLADEFDYMVTPLIFDLDLSFKSEDYEIENVYGTDSVNKTTGSIMHINTLFPSSSNSDGEVKGGIVVLKLKKKAGSISNNISLNISYKDSKEQEHSNKEKVEFKQSMQDYYDNTGIQKAIVLARYVNTLKNWIIYERSNNQEFIIDDNTGITEFDYDESYIKDVLGVHERKSTKLTVSGNYKEIFKLIKSYIEEENKTLKDDTLKNEIDILDKLI